MVRLDLRDGCKGFGRHLQWTRQRHRETKGYKQAFNFRRTQPLIIYSCRQKLERSVEISFSSKSPLMGSDGTRPKSWSDTPKSSKLNQEAPGNNGQNFESNFWPLLSGSAADSVSCHVVQPNDGVYTRALNGNCWQKSELRAGLWLPKLLKVFNLRGKNEVSRERKRRLNLSLQMKEI